MKITFLFILIACFSFGQSVYPVVIDNSTSDGLSLVQASVNNPNEIACWFTNDFGKNYFGFTNFDSQITSAFAFDLTGFSDVKIKKGATLNSGKFLTLINLTASGNGKLSYLFCHNGVGTMYWQRMFDNTNGGTDIEGADLALLGDSIIGVVCKRNAVNNSTVYILDTLGNQIKAINFTNVKVDLIEPHSGNTFWLSGSSINSGNQNAHILVLEKNGTLLKEFTIPNNTLVSSRGSSGKLNFYSINNLNQEAYSVIDSAGFIGSSAVDASIYSQFSSDLLAYKNYDLLINQDGFQGGMFKFMTLDTLITLHDYVQPSYFLPVNDTLNLLYSKGPFYGLKSNFNQPHVGIETMDSLFNINQFNGCMLFNLSAQSLQNQSITLQVTNTVNKQFSDTVLNLSYSNSPHTLNSLHSCIDIYGSLDENQVVILKIYPNPVKDILTLDLNEIILNTVQLKGIDGKLVSSIGVQGHLQQINVSDLDPGTYFVSGTTASGQEVVARFIKQ